MGDLMTLAAPGSRVPPFLPALAKIATLAGALVSLACMFWAGQHNRSVLLAALFTVWVASPFAALLWARRFAYWYTYAAQAMIYALVFLVSVGSAAFYVTAAFGPHWSKPALPFLAAPLLSWFVIALVVLVIRLSFGGRFRPARNARG